MAHNMNEEVDLFQPTVSVVMSNYNYARFLPQALEAILAQSYRPKEIIIIDDASTDHSVAVIEQFACQEPLIRFIRNERNMGILHNLTRLLELASGDYLYGAASDDKVLPGFLEKSMSLLARYPQAGLCSTLSRLIDENGVDNGVFPNPVVAKVPSFLPPEKVRTLLTTLGSWFMGNTTIYRRTALIEAGGFRPELHSFTDGFITQVLALKHGACFIPEPLAAWRRMETGYAATTGRDVDIQMEIISCARQLMQTQYQDLFPPGYVKLWETETRFFTGLAVHQSLQAHEEKFLDQMRSLQPDSHPFNPLLHFLLRSSIHLRTGLTLCYLFLRYFPRQAVRRRLHRLIHRPILP
jgi:hypothetical protein